MEGSVIDENEGRPRPFARNSVELRSSVVGLLEFPDAIDPRVWM